MRLLHNKCVIIIWAQYFKLFISLFFLLFSRRILTLSQKPSADGGRRLMSVKMTQEHAVSVTTKITLLTICNATEDNNSNSKWNASLLCWSTSITSVENTIFLPPKRCENGKVKHVIWSNCNFVYYRNSEHHFIVNEFLNLLNSIFCCCYCWWVVCRLWW